MVAWQTTTCVRRLLPVSGDETDKDYITGQGGNKLGVLIPNEDNSFRRLLIYCVSLNCNSRFICRNEEMSHKSRSFMAKQTQYCWGLFALTQANVFSKHPYKILLNFSTHLVNKEMPLPFGGQYVPKKNCPKNLMDFAVINPLVLIP